MRIVLACVEQVPRREVARTFSIDACKRLRQSLLWGRGRTIAVSRHSIVMIHWHCRVCRSAGGGRLVRRGGLLRRRHVLRW